MAFVHGTGPLGGTGTEGWAATEGRGVSSGRMRSGVVPGADVGDGATAAENGPGRAVALDGGGSVGVEVPGAVPGAVSAGVRPGVVLSGTVLFGMALSGLVLSGSELLEAGGSPVVEPGLRAPPVVVVALAGPSTGRGVVAAPPVEARFAAGTGVPAGAPAVMSTQPTSSTAEASATHRRRQ